MACHPNPKDINEKTSPAKAWLDDPSVRFNTDNVAVQHSLMEFLDGFTDVIANELKNHPPKS